MKVHTLRAVATALLLGGAVIGTTVPVAAQTVSAAVGAAINEAKSLAASKRYKEAMSRLDAAPAKTAGENSAINQMKQYIAVQSGDASVGGALGARAKFAQDANAGRWREVIAGGEALRKAGSLDAQSQLVIAQAYYKIGDSKGCVNYIKSNLRGAGENAMILLQRCAFDAHDDVTQRQALEQLVAVTGKPDHWKSLLRLSERSQGLTDHNSLDIYRIKGLTGSYNGEADITMHATLAIQLKMAAEAKSILEKGLADKTVATSERNNRLLKLATDRVNENNANAAKTLAAARAAPNGDALIAVGEDQVGQGKAKEGVATIQAGIAKKPTNPADAQVRLGAAYLAAGQKAEALRAFNAAKGDEKAVMIANLYALYARR